MSAPRYWTFALLGTAVCAAAVAAVSWATYALTSLSLCTPADERLGCEMGGDGLSAVIALAFILAIPFGSNLFAWRTRPRRGGIGLLAIALALTGACAAAFVVGIGQAGTSAELPGLLAAIGLAIVTPFLLIGAIAATFSGLDGSIRARAVARRAAQRGEAGDGVRFSSTVIDAREDPRAAREALANAGFGDLAAQLSQIAAARTRTDGGDVAAKLRQLDDLRASGLLTPDEHARKRRELLDAI